MRRGLILVTLTLAVVPAASGCGGGKTSSSQPGETSSLDVVSSIEDGATLARALHWTARPLGVASAAVERVDFLIDGKRRWSEHNPPYFFNDDGNLLHPWLLGAGARTLAVQVRTTDGERATTSSRVEIASAPGVPTALVGDFSRRVTAADAKRAATAREPASEGPPTGTWRIHVRPDGLILFDDPLGSGGAEAFTATRDGELTLAGPVNWRVPPERQGGFCEPARLGRYRWSAHEGRVTLSAEDESGCAYRDLVFTGAWNRD
jgi:hypothetical protein